MNKTKLKVTLLGAAFGYLLSEYVTVRRQARDIRRQVNDWRIDMAKIAWAQSMVEKEADHGRYEGRVIPDAVQEDFDYYLVIAPDPRINDRKK